MNSLGRALSRGRDCLVSGASLFLLAGSVHAAPGPADDRLKNDVVTWNILKNVTLSELRDYVSAHNDRVGDLRVVNTDPLKVTAIIFKNVGAYHVADEHIYEGYTFNGLHDALRANNRRPTVMQGYVGDDGTNRFVGVSVPNTGSNYRKWAGAYGTQSFVVANRPDGFRPTTLATWLNDDDERRYALIFVENVENYSWWWYFGVTRDFVVDSVPGGIIDASANDDDGMHLNVVSYGGRDGAPEFFRSYADLESWTDQFFRPLFTTRYTLHGTGTADGDPEVFTSLVNNY